MKTLLNGDCLERLKELKENSVDSIVTDPPAGIAFMNKEWDKNKGGRNQWVKWMSEVMRECHRVLKPGAHGFVWALPRTSHWTAWAIEEAGFEIRDSVHHVFGSGFPKSLDVSKAIDKAAGAEREVIGRSARHTSRGKQFAEGGSGFKVSDECFVTVPSTDEAKQWQGFGTALKPAHEVWWLIRKPISEKTVAKNVLKYGTGSLNIDGARVEFRSESDKNSATPQGKVTTKTPKDGFGKAAGKYGTERVELERQQSDQGRFPANFLLSHSIDCADECAEDCPVKELDGQSGPCKTGNIKAGTLQGFGKGKNTYGEGNVPREFKTDDATGASRFFKSFYYTAKASKRERNEGLEGMPLKEAGIKNDSGRGFSESDPHRKIMMQNSHPTVKPQKLMRYLCKMITPPSGTVLDPFMGSGSTGVAAISEGFSFIGIEAEAEYLEIAEKRIENVETPLPL